MNRYRPFRMQFLAAVALAQGSLVSATAATGERAPAPRVRMEEMTSTEIAAAIRAGKPPH